MERFSKLTHTVPLKQTTATAVMQVFIKEWVYGYGPQLNLLSENGKQLVAKFCQDVCRILGVKNLFTTTYHPPTNGQVERVNRTVFPALQYYVTEHPRDSDLYTNEQCYAYNTQFHSTKRLTPFNWELACRLPAVPLVLDLEYTSDTPTLASLHLK